MNHAEIVNAVNRVKTLHEAIRKLEIPATRKLEMQNQNWEIDVSEEYPNGAIVGREGADLIAEVHSNGQTAQEVTFNAKLLKYAPQLLRACKRLIAQVDQFGQLYGTALDEAKELVYALEYSEAGVTEGKDKP